MKFIGYDYKYNIYIEDTILYKDIPLIMKKTNINFRYYPSRIPIIEVILYFKTKEDMIQFKLECL